MSDTKKAWDILMEVSSELHEYEDAKGDIKMENGEARALNKMRKALEREICKDATDFLKAHGYNGYGLKRPNKKRR